MAKTRDQMAQKLEQDAAMNRVTSAQLLNNGADAEFVEELLVRARAWEEQATRLRNPLKRRQRGTA